MIIVEYDVRQPAAPWVVKVQTASKCVCFAYPTEREAKMKAASHEFEAFEKALNV